MMQLSDHATPVTDSGGSSPPLILLHGVGFDRLMWSATVPALTSVHRVVTYDLRGHGGAASAPGAFTYERFAGDLSDLLDALDLDRAHLAGLSFGGQVAQQFALSFPERVESLSLICTRASPFEEFASAAEAAEREGLASYVEPALARWFSPEALAAGDPAVSYARECILGVSTVTWAACLRLIARFDVLDRLAEITAPTRVIAAGLDTVATPRHMDEIAARISGASFHVVDGGRLLLCFERHAELAALLRSPERAPQWREIDVR